MRAAPRERRSSLRLEPFCAHRDSTGDGRGPEGAVPKPVSGSSERRRHSPGTRIGDTARPPAGPARGATAAAPGGAVPVRKSRLRRRARRRRESAGGAPERGRPGAPAGCGAAAGRAPVGPERCRSVGTRAQGPAGPSSRGRRSRSERDFHFIPLCRCPRVLNFLPWYQPRTPPPPLSLC